MTDRPVRFIGELKSTNKLLFFRFSDDERSRALNRFSISVGHCLGTSVGYDSPGITLWTVWFGRFLYKLAFFFSRYFYTKWGLSIREFWATFDIKFNKMNKSSGENKWKRGEGEEMWYCWSSWSKNVNIPRLSTTMKTANSQKWMTS